MKGLEQIRRDEAAAASRNDPMLNVATGTSDPKDPREGDFWYDRANDVFKLVKNGKIIMLWPSRPDGQGDDRKTQGPQVNHLDADTLDWCANALRVEAGVIDKQKSVDDSAAINGVFCGMVGALKAAADKMSKRAELERNR